MNKKLIILTLFIHNFPTIQCMENDEKKEKTHPIAWFFKLIFETSRKAFSSTTPLSLSQDTLSEEPLTPAENTITPTQELGITTQLMKIFEEQFKEKNSYENYFDEELEKAEEKLPSKGQEKSTLEQEHLAIIFPEEEFRELIIDGWRYFFHAADEIKEKYIMYGKHLYTRARRKYIIPKKVCEYYQKIYDDELMK